MHGNRAGIRTGCLAILLAIAGLLMPQAAMAWGVRGHKIVADIAQQDLSRGARIHVAQLLQTEKATKLAQIANWADTIKVNQPGAVSHSIRFAANGPLRMNACPTRFCLLAALDKYSAILADRQASPADRMEALKYVVHLVGDVHMPLHCFANTGDRVQVSFNDKPMTLHKLWDTGIINAHNAGNPQIEQELAGRKDPVGGRPIDWALESRNIARDQIFRSIPLKPTDPVTLPATYEADNWPIVATRLNQAGHRLGALLNRLLG